MDKTKKKSCLERIVDKFDEHVLAVGISATLTLALAAAVVALWKPWNADQWKYERGFKHVYEYSGSEYGKTTKEAPKRIDPVWAEYDFNADGKGEMIRIESNGAITVSEETKPGVYVYRATIGNVSKYIPNASGITIDIKDFNQDGRYDVIIMDKDRVLQQYQNNFRQGNVHPIQMLVPKK
jgi:hypothetical protein